MTDNEARLLAGLKLLAKYETRLPPPELEEKLKLQIRPVRKRWPVFLAVAALVLLAAFVRKEPWKGRPIESAVTPVASTPLVPIPYAEPVYGTERTELVRVNIPVAQLISWGFSASGTDPSSRVNADVLMGEGRTGSRGPVSAIRRNK